VNPVQVACLGVWLAVSLAGSVRLLALARRSRGLPELSMGAVYLLGGILGYAPSILVFPGGPVSDAWVPLARGTGQLFYEATSVALLIFVWRVFHREDRWAGAVVGLLCVLQLVTFSGSVISGGLEHRIPEGAWWWLDLSVRSVPFGWAAFASFAHYHRTRKRCALGLADPVVADRFFWWGISMASVVGIFASWLLLGAALGLPLEHQGRALIDAFFVLLASVGVWLSFFAPASYRQRLVNRRYAAGRHAAA
jgi:hypothetical protein